MKRRRSLSVMLPLLLAALLSACGGSSTTTTTVTVSPQAISVVLGGTQQFTATVSGPSDTTVSWSVSGSGCSGTACGTINTNGLYTAPNQQISPNTVSITATSNADTKATGTASLALDSGIRVQISPQEGATIGSGEQYNFTATVTGTTNTQLTWNVNGTPNGDSTVGEVCAVGSNPCQAPTNSEDEITFQAPPSLLGTVQVKLEAVSVADTTQSSTVTVTLMPEVPPVISSISPPATAQGAVMQTVYVNAEAPATFFSTSTILASGEPVPTTFISTSLLRGEVPAGRLQSGQTVQIAVQSQNGQVSNSVGLEVTPVRPSIVSFSPVSVPQCPSASCGPATVTLDGGYLSPSTVVAFNGQTVGAILNNPNQIAVSLPGSALQTAGLYQLTLTNSGATQPESAVNVAVEPAASVNPPAVLATVGVGQQPSAVAVDPSTGMAIVANSGANTISLVNLPACSGGSCPVSSINVGNKPTGVAVDPFRRLAMVVNQGDNTLSLVDLTGVNPTQTINLPAGYIPVSVGENPLTGHALVANQDTNEVTVVDLSQNPAVVTLVDVTQGGTRSGGTGLDPRVAIEPRLDWAIITPGGSGAISAIDMSHKVISPVTAQPTFNVVFSFTLTTTVTGVAVNPSTDEMLLADPNSDVAEIFSLFNETVQPVTNPNNTTTGIGYANIASAVNPLTNVGLLADQQTNSVQLVDMTGAQVFGSPLTVGGTPIDVAFDPVSDQAVVVNQADSTVSVLTLGAVRPLAITEASASRLFTSTSTQSVTLVGGGFASTATVRINGSPLPSSDVQWVSGREINVTIPSSSLSAPENLNFDVQNPNGTLSGIFQIPVIQAVPVGTAPMSVAIDPASDTAVVSNSGADTVSLVDLASGGVSATVDVGSDPLGVDVFSRLGYAVIANSGDDTASLLDLCTPASPDYSSSCVPSATAYRVASTTGVVQQPVAVAIDSDEGVAAIADEQSNAVTLMNALTGSISSQFLVDEGPIGIGIDQNIGYLAALCDATSQPTSPPMIDIANFPVATSGFIAVLSGHITGANLPTGIALDPVNDVFLIADSTGNRILIVNPQANKITQAVATGINPVSIAYNYNALEAVTVNTESHTASLVEVTPNGSAVRSLMLIDGSSQQSVAIDPLTNLAVVADEQHNQVLLVPLGH